MWSLPREERHGEVLHRHRRSRELGLAFGHPPEVPQLVAAAFSLLTTEARYAAWARRIAGFLPVANAFDEPKTIGEVDRVVRSTRFIASRPRTRGRGSPRFIG